MTDAEEVAAERVRDVDRAALLGTALAAVVALTFGGEGEWDWLATVSGGALVAIIAAFFRLPRSGRRRHAELVAMAAVVGLAGALVLGAPLQAVLSATPVAQDCRAAAALAEARVQVTDRYAAGQAAMALATDGRPPSPDDVLAAAAAERGRAVFGACVGAATSQLLWIPALAISGLIVAVAEVRLRRGRR